MASHLAEKGFSMKNKMCLCNTNAPDNGQFQRWPRLQRKSNIYHLEFITDVNFMKNK